jgi:hypothetical protein
MSAIVLSDEVDEFEESTILKEEADGKIGEYLVSDILFGKVVDEFLVSANLLVEAVGEFGESTILLKTAKIFWML